VAILTIDATEGDRFPATQLYRRGKPRTCLERQAFLL
jgi:hypothetical protein